MSNTSITVKDKINQQEVDRLIEKYGFDMDTIKKNFDITKEPTKRTYDFNVEEERQYAIKVLYLLVSKLNQRQRERILQRAIKLNKV
tara:strand:+ start:14487 stop:14747 length:261 start_codon:yes stop_codon:yes gene_type:complete